MKLDQCLQTIDKCLSEIHLFNKIIRFHRNEGFRSVFIRITGHIRKMDNNDTTDYLDISEDEINKTLIMTRDILIDNPIDDSMFEFFKAWLMLIKNWINNIVSIENFKNIDFSNSKKIIYQCETLIDNFLTMKESIDIMKRLLSRIDNFRHWMPPAFEVNKSFLRYLDEEPQVTEPQVTEPQVECDSECDSEDVINLIKV